MPVVGYLLGVLELGLFVLGIGSVARALRLQLLPTWRGPHAVLSTVVLMLAAACLVLQLLGAVGLLRGWALTVTGVVLVVVTGRRGLRGPEIRGSVWPPEIPWRAALSVGLVASLLAVWTVEIRGVVLHGVFDVDSLSYHLPFAQEWARTHRVGPLIHVDPGTPVQYYPGNAELLRSAGLVTFGRDVLGPYLNLAWLGMLLLAAVSLGLRRRRTLSVLAMVVVVAGGPLIAKFLPGGAMSDVAALAAVLALAALLLESFDSGDLGGLAVAGAAAGLAVGTKLTVLPMLGTLTLALLLVPSVRWRAWSGFVAGLAVPAAFWYVRDLVLTGSPVPFLAVPGLPSPAFSLFDHNAQSVLHYATDARVIGKLFVPMSYQVLGPAWWLLVLIFLAGVVAALRTRRPAFGVLGTAALVGGVAYLATPTTAGGPEGVPLLFAVDLRYALPSLLLAGCLLPLVLHGRPALVLEGVLVLAAVATLLAPWRLTVVNDQNRVPTLVLGVLAGLGAAHGLRLRMPGWLVIVLAVVALYPLADLAQRRVHNDTHAPAAYRYFRSTAGLRVAVTGDLHTGPYAGRRFGNEVRYLGVVTSDGGFENLTSCKDWRRAAVAARADAYVVDGFARQWVNDRAFVPLVPEHVAEPRVLRLAGPPSPATCP